MSDGWSSITLESFEVVPGGPTRALLRVSGRGSRWRAAGPRPTLVIERGGTEQRFDPLPAPDDPRGVLRAAYSVPAGLIGDDGRFRLEHRPGVVTELPAPSLRKAIDASARAAPAMAEEPREAPAPPQQVQEQLGAALAERDELMRRVMELEQSAAEAGERLREAEAAHQRLSESHQELDTWRGELERRLADTTTELSVARVERDSAREELQSAHEELRTLREELQAAHEELRVLREARGVEPPALGGVPAEPEPPGRGPSAPAASANEPSATVWADAEDRAFEEISKTAERRAAERAEEELRALVDKRRSR